MAITKLYGSILADVEFGGDYLKIPDGTTAERPLSPDPGMLRFNTSIGLFEGYDGTEWELIGGPISIDNVNEFFGYGVSTPTEKIDVDGNIKLTGNVMVGGYISGPSSFIIDPAGVGDNTGNVIIAGNLQVDGTTTTINSTTVTIDDKNLILSSGAPNAVASNGSGITIDLGTDGFATLTYTNTNDQWELNKTLNISGGVDIAGDITGAVNINGDNLFVSNKLGKNSTNDYLTWVDNGTSDYLSIFVTGNEKFRMQYDGDFHADGDVIAYSTTISDIRLKEDISIINNALEKIQSIRGVTFKRKDTNRFSAGVIAQELEKVLPEAIIEKPLPLQKNDNVMYKMVEYDALHGLLIQAIKELYFMVKEKL